MKKSVIITICAGAIATGPLQAQNHPTVPDEGDVKIIFNPGEPDQKVYDAFIENAPKRFNEPSAPRFAIKGNQDKF